MCVEKWVSLAEIEYKSGNISAALNYAKEGLAQTGEPEKITAFKIFIARCHAKIGNINESNQIYRELVKEKIYLPPVIMGLLYNNLHNNQKAKNNLRLMRVFFPERKGAK